ncbi:MAG TPA: CHAT domain-containing protein [Thermoanaerobaculia bacterium]|nr:CHAT domain-containing protein [Thermoanaerobaculia bacterium]
MDLDRREPAAGHAERAFEVSERARARVLLEALAPARAASPRPVDDSATAGLMRRFYRGMLMDGLPPAAALAAAQNSLRQEPGWEAPYYWAGFVLQGDP